MTLKRLMIILGILVFLAGVGIAWLWQYAYSPEGRARVIVAQLRGDNDTTLRGWMLKHHLIRQGFPEPPPEKSGFGEEPSIPASDEMVKLGPKILPIVLQAMKDENYDVRFMAIRACGDFRDPRAILPLNQCMQDTTGDIFIRSVSWTLCRRSLEKLGVEPWPASQPASKP